MGETSEARSTSASTLTVAERRIGCRSRARLKRAHAAHADVTPPLDGVATLGPFGPGLPSPPSISTFSEPVRKPNPRAALVALNDSSGIVRKLVHLRG